MSRSRKVAYIRISSASQNTDRQDAEFEGMELDHIFRDIVSGKDTNRPDLQEMLQRLWEGDIVYCKSLDRLGRNFDDLRGLVGQITSKGATITFIKENLTFSPDVKQNSMQELMFNMLASFAQFERSLIRERQAEGIAAAKAKGVYKKNSRPIEMTPDRIAELRSRVAAGEAKAKVAKDMKISRDTLYRYLQDKSA